MQLIIQIQSEPCSGKRIWLGPGQAITVGRTEGSEFALPHDPTMSHVHFALKCKAGTCHIRDLKSTGGTFLNGKKIGEAALCHGDKIVAGLTRFAVRIEGGQPASGGAPVETEPDRAIEETSTSRQPTIVELACGSGQRLFMGQTDQTPPTMIARRLAETWPMHIIVDSNNADLPLPPQYDRDDFLFDWLPKDDRPGNSPIVLSASDEVDLTSLIEETWGKDAAMCVFSRLEKPQLLSHLRRQAGTFCRPSILRPQLAAGAAEFVRQLLSGLDAVLLEGEHAQEWAVWAGTDPHVIEQ